MDARKKLLVVLITVAIGVWGYNLYQLRGSMAPDRGDVTAPAGTERFDVSAFALQGSSYTYVPSARDPFQHRLFPVKPKPVPVKKTEPKKKAKPEPVRKKPFPQLALQGVMGDMTNPMAIILDPNGKTHLSRVGQVIMGAKIVRIEQKLAVFEWEGEEKVLELKQR